MPEDKKFGLLITLLSQNELAQVSLMFRQSFPNSLISQIDDSFATLFFDWLIRHAEVGFSLTTIKQPISNDLLGFCILTRGRPLKQFVIQNWLGMTPHLIAHPTLALIAIKKQIAAALARKTDELAHGNPLRQSLWLLALAVDSHMRCKGIGTALMDEAESKACSEGFTELTLEVDPENDAAINFYKRRGFELRRNTGVPFLAMRKTLA